jgi:hypothetical protein
MLPEVLRLLRVDLDRKIAEIRTQAEEFRAKTTRLVAEQVKETSLTIGFALIGATAAIATFIIILVALYRWVGMYHGPFAALGAVGVVLAMLAAVMFLLAFGRRGHKPAFLVVDRSPAVSPPPSPPPPQPIAVALSAALPPPPPNASLFDVLTHRFSTRVVAAGDEALDAAVRVMRTGSKSTVFGTLAVTALVGVLLGRRHR